MGLLARYYDEDLQREVIIDYERTPFVLFSGPGTASEKSRFLEWLYKPLVATCNCLSQKSGEFQETLRFHKSGDVDPNGRPVWKGLSTENLIPELERRLSKLEDCSDSARVPFAFCTFDMNLRWSSEKQAVLQRMIDMKSERPSLPLMLLAGYWNSLLLPFSFPHGSLHICARPIPVSESDIPSNPRDELEVLKSWDAVGVTRNRTVLNDATDMPYDRIGLAVESLRRRGAFRVLPDWTEWDYGRISELLRELPMEVSR